MSQDNKTVLNGKDLSRRQFLVGTGAVAGAAALFGASGLTPGNLFGVKLASAQTLNSDVDILNFALTLEYVETSTYNYINSQGLLSGTAKTYAQKFGDNENTHVALIVSTIKQLGGTPINPQDYFNLPDFPDENSIIQFLIASEEVGAGAYLGAAPLVKDKNILAAAAAIHNVEAQHASGFKALLNDPMPSPAFGAPLTPAEVVSKLVAAYGPNATNPGSGSSPRIVFPNMTTGPVPPPGGVGSTTGVGMPATGRNSGGDPTALFGPLGIAAALFATGVGAMLKVRSRETAIAEENADRE